MSSMFKKKGGLAFKPKIPSTRSRPTATPSFTSKSAPDEGAALDRVVEPTLSHHGDSHISTEASTRQLPAAVVDERSKTQENGERGSITSGQEVLNQEPGSELQDSGPEVTPQPAVGRGSSPRLEPFSATPVPTAGSIASTQPPEKQSLEPTPLTAEEQAAAALLAAAAAAADSRVVSTTDDAEPAASAVRLSTSLEEPPRRRSTKRKAARSDAEPGRPQPRKRKVASEESGATKTPRKRKARSSTPEDAETRVVDLQTLKMSDLTRDLHIGKKFSRHDELREREKQKRIKAKLAKGGEEDEGSKETRAELAQSQLSGPSRTSSQTPAGEALQSGPQFRIVDGQIVVDQTSLVMDRHARAAAAQAGEDMETIEENDFTRLITSNSFMNTSKLRGPNTWSDVETELFYRGLKMFGTDFEMISKMFPGKQRRHVKLKFNREERHNPKRIDAVLIGEKTTKMDIDEYKTITGSQFESVEKIEAEQKKIEEDYEAERKRIADEQAEIMRKKKEELFADDEAKDDQGKKKKKGRKKKDKVAYGLNGEPVGTEA